MFCNGELVIIWLVILFDGTDCLLEDASRRGVYEVGDFLDNVSSIQRR